MKKCGFCLGFLLLAVFAWADVEIDLENAIVDAGAAAEQLKNPGLSDDQRTQVEKKKEAAVQKVESAAASRPDDAALQLKVGKGLASVEEAPRAIPYAERGLALAETSRDPKLIRDALLTGSEVYAKAGRYDLARERAERILKANPTDKDALALYMQVKGRGTASSAPVTGGSTAGAGGAGGQKASGGAPTSGPGVAMTSAASLEAQKQIALGWSRMSLDPNAALKHFEAAITADPTNAAVRVQRSKARLAAGDPAGALGDSDDAIRMDPRLGEAYAARGEAKRALGRGDAELVADFEAAANLDGRFTEAYKNLMTRLTPAASGAAGGEAGSPNAAGSTAPDGIRGLLERPPRKWGVIALICVLAAVAGGLLVPLLLRKKRFENAGTPPPTPRP